MILSRADGQNDKIAGTTREPRGSPGMNRAEIEFCERWCELRGSDGLVQHGPGRGRLPELLRSAEAIELYTYRHTRCLRALNPRGADLVASYEAAKAQGLEIRADDEPLDEARRVNAEAEAFIAKHAHLLPERCPECESRGRVPVSFGGAGRSIVDLVDGPDGRADDQGREQAVILPGWDVTCPRCKGAKVVAQETFESVERPLEGLAHVYDGVMAKAARMKAGLTEWQQLTRVVGERLAAKGLPVEIRRPTGGRVYRGIVETSAPMGMAVSGLPFFAYDGEWWVRAVGPGPGAGGKDDWEDEMRNPKARGLDDRSDIDRADRSQSPGCWVTTRDGVVALLAEAQRTGRRVMVDFTPFADTCDRGVVSGQVSRTSDGVWSVKTNDGPTGRIVVGCERRPDLPFAPVRWASDDGSTVEPETRTDGWAFGDTPRSVGAV